MAVAASTEDPRGEAAGSTGPGPLVVVFGRRDCCLCDEAWEVIEGVREGEVFRLQKVDVDSDPALAQRYGHEVPVIEIDGRKAFKFRVSRREFRRRLRRVG